MIRIGGSSVIDAGAIAPKHLRAPAGVARRTLDARGPTSSDPFKSDAIVGAASICPPRQARVVKIYPLGS